MATSSSSSVPAPVLSPVDVNMIRSSLALKRASVVRALKAEADPDVAAVRRKQLVAYDNLDMRLVQFDLPL